MIENDKKDIHSFLEIDQNSCLNKAALQKNIPRSSSAPPMPPRMSIINMYPQIINGRPASADERSYQAVTCKSENHKVNLHLENKPESFNEVLKGNTTSSCECSIQEAMIVCRRCGAFCHDNCISSQYVCAICLIG
ncbi:polycomb protein Asx [Copidosoma floridanum]|uniref:polycomb protein Asx n=1 Tax=Copidosoma floridanum TaxID=29053 RepID=UPI0006C99A49|nr:polycomb protein Asx [Copidosoma floridanum]